MASDDPERGVAFLWAGKAGGAMLGLWSPAAAVYFHDHDGHMLEYLATLDAPPRPEAGVVTRSDWAGRA